ncbi:MAG: flagellar type III secretion system pore protein FliP [Phycisphaerales bacterium]|nr:flagellar type III secretion system pore protein FliP [Phycisphaerales bacterium]
MRHAERTTIVIIAIMAAIAMLITPAAAVAQEPYGPFAQPATRAPISIDPSRALGDDVNPLSIVGSVGDTIAGMSRTGVPRSGDRGGATQESSGGLSAGINIMVLLTVITLVPSIMLMCTCFVRIVIVLGLLKQALGTQSLPPPQVIVGLAMFMTLLVMSPTLDRIHREAILPYRSGEVQNYDELWAKAKQPLRDFMFDQIEATNNWSSVYMILNYRGIDTSDPSKLSTDNVDMITLIPAFMLSELKTGFLIGFKVFLPFLVIDIVISSLLISMGMMMLPPVLISLPFKLLLFVLVDGWTLVVGSLLQSFVVRPAPSTAISLLSDPLSIAPLLQAIGFS